MNNILLEYKKLKQIIEETIKYIEENEYSIKLGENRATYDTIETEKLISSKKVLKKLKGE